MTFDEAVNFLAQQGFDVKSIRAQAQERVELIGSPNEWDVMYHVPTVAPSLADHFPEGADRLPRALDARWMWPGYHYTLTPGQRKWFREVMGLTPSMTVTLDWVQVWDGTDHPRSFKITSDQHLANNRRHLLVAATVPAGKFFFESAQFDTEIREAGAEVAEDGTVRGAKPRKPASASTKSSPKLTFEEMMQQLESEAQ